MTIGHMVDNPRPFKRSKGGGGGSKKGKAQKNWPIFSVVIADAVIMRVKGSIGAWLVDRRNPVTDEVLKKTMEDLLPGFWVWVAEYMGKRKTPYENLLKNRVYKQYYNGTSARGKHHDPNTRASVSNELWRSKVPPDHPLHLVHEQVERGLVTRYGDWKARLYSWQVVKKEMLVL